MIESTSGAIVEGTKRVVCSEAGELKTDMLEAVRANLHGVLDGITSQCPSPDKCAAAILRVTSGGGIDSDRTDTFSIFCRSHACPVILASKET